MKSTFQEQAAKKYKHYETISLPQRTWPDKRIEKAPIWCSVDLRDGNQALEKPMTLDQKMRFFKKLVEIGFKQIEIGFPAASSIEFDFARKLIEENHIPDDVKVQVLVPAREELIAKTRASLIWAKNIIVHLYNSTSQAQREVVFKKSKEEIIALALEWIHAIKKYFADFSGNITLEYSPESFTGTELPFARDTCLAVIKAWDNMGWNPVIINLPATVEMSTANVFADQIEWMKNEICRVYKNTIIGLHNHNDRGTGTSITELWLLAGGTRVEGTLFGNGERTGNTDIINLALNMYTQGIDPELDLHDIEDLKELYEDITGLSVSPRHPYAWELVFTAFSGSHQDAINKWLKAQEKKEKWDVPYLPIDPKDIGRSYQGIIRVNSQSWKGWVAYILEQNGYKIPKAMQKIVWQLMQKETEKISGTISEKNLVKKFEEFFINREEKIRLKEIHIHEDFIEWVFEINGKEETFKKEKSGGIIETFASILQNLWYDFTIFDYEQFSCSEWKGAEAVSYFALKYKDTVFYWGGKNRDVVLSSLYGLISTLNIGIDGKRN